MQRCSRCNHEINDNINFCPYCGEKVVRNVEKICNLCGSIFMDENMLYCSNCGSRLNIRVQAARSPIEQQLSRRDIITIDDLVDRLNDASIKIDKAAEKITSAELEAFCDLNDTSRYSVYYKHKKRKGTYRMIAAPNPRLKFVLKCLNEILCEYYSPASYVTGFVRKMSIVDNGKIHIGQRYVYAIDLSNFFESVKVHMIKTCLCHHPFNFNEMIANTIAAISCVKNIKNETYCLSQGSPLSPILSNIVCQEMDKKLNGLSSFYGAKYSRYADDITFSSSQNLFTKYGDFSNSVKRIIMSCGFKINYNKIHTYGPQSCHYVTGIVANEKSNVSRDYILNIRNLIYIWEKHGIRDAYRKFDQRFQKKNKGSKTPFIGDSLRGQIEHLGMVRGKSDALYLKFKTKFEMLMKVPFTPFCGRYDESTHRYGRVDFDLCYPIMKNGQKYYTAIGRYTGEHILISPKLNEYIESRADAYPAKKLARSCAYFKIFDIDGVKILMAKK